MSTHGEAVEDIKKAKNVIDHIPVETTQKYPDAKKHLYISLAKSAIRIVAGVCLIQGNLLMAGVCFIMAEVLGIVEELV
jgi:hypothetical protein